MREIQQTEKESERHLAYRERECETQQTEKESERRLAYRERE